MAVAALVAISTDRGGPARGDAEAGHELRHGVSALDWLRSIA